MASYIQFIRGEASEELLRHPNAFALLALIAVRARREVPRINPHGLRVGEAMVGDHGANGLTRQQFRTALANLQTWGFITTRPTNKGTIAKLATTAVYDINADPQQPASQPVNNHQPNQSATTKKNVKKDKNEKEEGLSAPSPVVDLAAPMVATRPAEPRRPPAGVPPDEAKVFTISGFREFLKSIGFGAVDTGYYLPLVQRAAEKTGEERPNDGKGRTWEDFVEWYFKNERTHNRLTYPLADNPNTSYQVGQRPAPTTTTASYAPAALAAQNQPKY